MSRWEQQNGREAFWDAAVAGSSCLHVALSRALLGEACTLVGAPAAQVLWDIKKFYDSIMPERLAKLAEDLRYPLVQLYMALAVHMPGRVIIDKGVGSRTLFPVHSILAGCTQSTAWSKVYLHDLLEEVHKRWRPT